MNRSGTLADRFRRLIAETGPISVARYMGESNAMYYASRDPLGAPRGAAGGDFVTAPEISQMFGEMVGLWLADVWVRAGRPQRAIYLELGPGRGTLARDALRAMASQGLRPQVHLVEASPVLRARQAGVLAGAVFHDSLETVPEDCPLLVVANEFFDALPVRQLIRTSAGWREVMVGLAGDALSFVVGRSAMDAAIPPCHAEAMAGTVIESAPAAAALMGDLARRIDLAGGVALAIDYGHLAPRTGSTLQAVRGHEKCEVFAAPGEADLTAHVDFAALREVAKSAGVATSMATQGAWLEATGISLRAQALAARNPGKANAIAADLNRLVAPEEMGELFKVFACSARDWPRGAGFV